MMPWKTPTNHFWYGECSRWNFAVTVASGFWAARRGQAEAVGAAITGTGNLAGGDITAERDVVGRDVYNIYQGASPSTTSQALHQLPPSPADFTGREAELAQLTLKMQPGGVTISGVRGMGGIGKTALALVLAHRLAPQYPDAQIFLDLRGTSPQPLTASEAMAHVIRSFDREAQLPESETELRPLFLSVLYEKAVLLLMDNAFDENQVGPLIPPEGCLLLVTSRPRCELPGLFPLDLDTLSDENAQALLLRICPRIGEEVRPLAHLCGNLPLALELAARALNHRQDLSPKQYRRRLEPAAQGFDAVDASLDLSYQLLTSELQNRWSALAVFPGPFALIAATVVWDVEREAAQDTLGSLLKVSLVEWDREASRYRLHDLARQFSGQQLKAQERSTAQRRHCAHFRDVLAVANRLFLEGGEELLAGLAIFDQEWGNIQAGQAWAAAHAKQKQGAALCSDYAGAAYILELRLHPQDWIRWLETAIAGARILRNRPDEIMHLSNMGLAYGQLGEYRWAIEYSERALAGFRAVANQLGESSSLGNLGNAYSKLGDSRQAIDCYEQQLAIAQEISDNRGEASALGSMGIAYADQGDLKSSRVHLEQQLAIAKDISDLPIEASALGGLGNVHRCLGDPHRAIDYYKRMLFIAKNLGDRSAEAVAIGSTGLALADLGQQNRAIEQYEMALKIERAIGDRRGEGTALWNLAKAYHEVGGMARAVELGKAALTILEELEHPAASHATSELERWLRER